MRKICSLGAYARKLASPAVMLLAAAVAVISGCGGTGTGVGSGGSTFTLTVTVNGTGTVSSTPPGISACTASSGTCSFAFTTGQSVSLTATGTTPTTQGTGTALTGWGGACSGLAPCTGLTATTAVTANFDPVGSDIWWVSKTGSDSNNGRTINTAFATFNKALTTMNAGDTLYVNDGVYNDAVGGGLPFASTIKSGTGLSSLTRIIGYHRHAVVVDGQYVRLPLSIWRKSYIEVNNMVFLHSMPNEDPVDIDGSIGGSLTHPMAPTATYIFIRNVGAGYANPGCTNCMGIAIEHGDHVTIEDCWVWGFGGRYGIMFHNGSNNIARRNIARYDGSLDGNPKAGLTLYSEDNSIAENNVVVDFDNGTDSTGDVHAALFTTASVTLPDPPFGLGTVAWYGNVAVNTTGQTNGVFFFDSLASIGGTITVANNVIANASGSTLAGIWVSNDALASTGGATHAINFSHNTVYNINATGSLVRVDAPPRWSAVTFNDNLLSYPTSATQGCFDDRSFAGLRISAANNQKFNCVGVVVNDASLLNHDPALSYLLRREPGTFGTAGNNPGTGGTDRGATIVKRYLNGTLTGTDLWPLPNEDIAKLDMCAGPDNGNQSTVPGPTIYTRRHNTTGWCASGLSLTKYVWQQLGNPSPY